MPLRDRRLLTLIALLPLLACSKGKDSSEVVMFQKVKRETLVKTVLVAGKVESASKVVVTAPLGNKIKDLKVTPGQSVAQGDVLLEYDEGAVLTEVTRLRTSVASKAAEIRNQELQLEGLKKRLERARAMFQQKVGAAKDVEDAERDFTALTNTLEVRKMEAKADQELLAHSETTLKNLVIKSPIAGVVTSLWLGNETFTPGTPVKEGEKLVTVSGTSKLVIDSRLPEADVAAVSEKSPVLILLDAFKGRKFEGKIERLAPTPEVDPQSGISTFPVRIGFAKDQAEVRPGMTAQCNIQVAKKEGVLVIPLNAVKHDGVTEVAEVVKGGEVAKRPLKLGLSNDFAAEVLEGVEEGEAVRVP